MFFKKIKDWLAKKKREKQLGALKKIAGLPMNKRKFLLPEELGESFESKPYYNLGYNSKVNGFICIELINLFNNEKN